MDLGMLGSTERLLIGRNALMGLICALHGNSQRLYKASFLPELAEL